MRAPGRCTSQVPAVPALASFLVSGAAVGAQGCEPIRFTRHAVRVPDLS